MGDDLAQILFETLQAQPTEGLPNPPFRPIGWAELDDNSRRAWEAVAARARREMDRRWYRDIRDAVAAHGAEQTIANLLEEGAN
jgi:hypothetical protein